MKVNLRKFLPTNRNPALATYLAAISITTIACALRDVPGILGDDGAFFLKYAENMAKGFYWHYNSTSEPVWGASAPLYPVLIAPLLKLGIPPVVAVKLLGISLLNASSIIAIRFFYSTHYCLGLLTVALLSISTNITANTVAGLETPLTVFLLSSSLLLLMLTSKSFNTRLANRGLIFISVFSVSLLAINKIDLIPVASVILYCMTRGMDKLLRVCSISFFAAVQISFYTFAWRYFGFPLPNSFLTKSLHQEHLTRIITNDWYIKDLLFTSPLPIVFSLVAIACILLLVASKFTQRHALSKMWIPQEFIYPTICLIVLLLTFTLGYSIKPPFEPYSWYIAPANLAISYLCPIGLIASQNFLSYHYKIHD